MAMRKVKTGVIGCGMISGIYLKNCTGTFQHILEVTACADQIPELARKRAEEFQIPRALAVDELLADPGIEIVLNLTAAAAHAPINLRALRAGKHVYTEKPFALTREEADSVLALADSQGLLVGCAPDTFLGAGLQTCRKLIRANRVRLQKQPGTCRLEKGEEHGQTAAHRINRLRIRRQDIPRPGHHSRTRAQTEQNRAEKEPNCPAAVSLGRGDGRCTGTV